MTQQQQKPKNPASAVGIQLVIAIMVMAFAGYYLDQYFELEQPVFLLSLTLITLILGLIQLVRKISN